MNVRPTELLNGLFFILSDKSPVQAVVTPISLGLIVTSILAMIGVVIGEPAAGSRWLALAIMIVCLAALSLLGYFGSRLSSRHGRRRRS